MDPVDTVDTNANLTPSVAFPGLEIGEDGGWLALIGGGEFSFEETLDADAAWVEKAAPGPIGFVPAASGSMDYSRHFSEYMAEVFDREVEVLPIFRRRDARRGRNLERLDAMSAIYVGGGSPDQLLDALVDTPALEHLAAKLRAGGVVATIAGAAQAFGLWSRSLRFGEALQGLSWLPGGVVEPNFDPQHDRRLRRLLARPGVRWGVGLPASSALLFGPQGAVEQVGPAWSLPTEEGVLEELGAETGIQDTQGDGDEPFAMEDDSD